MVHTFSPKGYPSDSNRSTPPRVPKYAGHAGTSSAKAQGPEGPKEWGLLGTEQNTLLPPKSEVGQEQQPSALTPPPPPVLGVLPGYTHPQMAMMGLGLGTTVPISPADKELYLKMLQNSQHPFGQLPLQAYYAMEGMNGLGKLPPELVQPPEAKPKKGRRKRSTSKGNGGGVGGRRGTVVAAMDHLQQPRDDAALAAGGNKAFPPACVSGTSPHWVGAGGHSVTLWAVGSYLYTLCLTQPPCCFLSYSIIHQHPSISAPTLLCHSNSLFPLQTCTSHMAYVSSHAIYFALYL